MSRPSVVAVTHCQDCPFCEADGSSILEEPWHCTAAMRRGLYRELAPRVVMRRDGDKVGEWLPPPRWCPLRKAGRLVQLRLP